MKSLVVSALVLMVAALHTFRLAQGEIVGAVVMPHGKTIYF